MKDKQLIDLLNRRPNRWGNLSIKEFERDILLLNNTVLELQQQIEEEKEKTKLYLNRWVSSTIDNIEMMDEYIPEWRSYAKKEIKQLKALLKERV